MNLYEKCKTCGAKHASVVNGSACLRCRPRSESWSEMSTKLNNVEEDLKIDTAHKEESSYARRKKDQK